MKCLVKININVINYHSTDWEEKDIEMISYFNGVLADLEIRKHYCVYWSEIEFKSQDDEQHFKKLSIIKSII